MDIQPQSTPERVAASITRVVDSLGNSIPNPGTTQDTVMTLSGSGTASSVIFIYDNGVLLTTASVTINGTWSFSPETLVLGQHVFTVRDGPGGVDSPEWVVTVDSAELDLRPPAVTQAPTGTLNPVDAINGATVVVTYAMQPTDTIGISWNGQDNLVPTQPGSALGSVTFTIPASAVAAVIGKAIQVLYAVVRNGVAKPSEVLDLTVQTLAHSNLEAPRILQATDGFHLNVGTLTGDADLKVKPWPFIAAGQLISLRFDGTKADGTAYNWAHPTWQNLPIGSAGEPSTTVALSNLMALKDGSTISPVFDVSFDDGLTKVLFPVRPLSVIQGNGGFEGFETIAPMQIPRLGGVVIPETGIRLTSLGGTDLAAVVRAENQQGEHGFQYVSVFLNSVGDSMVYIDLPTKKFKTIRFTLWAVTYAPDLHAQVRFLGPDYEHLGYLSVQIPPDGRVSETYTAPGRKHIYQMSVRVAGRDRAERVIACDSIYWSE
ncbi:hypothetical protein [Pseudomonas viridiflava]|uniref:hypothetical protein n=1 Tax=Pseudomonas viridiflava TaxID=33069 RepID=UPI000F047C95|nr:hypothetical protein [Pseudomonas viridiflava]